jgi:asparagine synthase (glutamine-hydrolysing)
LFGGYHRYRTYLLNRRLASVYRLAPRALRAWIRGRIGSTSLLSASLRRKLGHTILGREAGLESLYLENFCAAFSRAELNLLMNRPEASRAAFSNYLAYWNAGNRSSLSRLLYTDQKTYLVELLMKQDQMSMACSIESRVPLLDHQFVEFAAAVPDRLKLHDGSGKYILKKAVDDLLPADIIWRRKRGFPTPLSKWLLDPEIQPRLEALTAPGTFLADYLDAGAIRRVVEDHRRGVRDNTDRLWRLLNLKIWAERVLSVQSPGIHDFPAARQYSGQSADPTH